MLCILYATAFVICFAGGRAYANWCIKEHKKGSRKWIALLGASLLCYIMSFVFLVKTFADAYNTTIANALIPSIITYTVAVITSRIDKVIKWFGKQ